VLSIKPETRDSARRSLLGYPVGGRTEKVFEATVLRTILEPYKRGRSSEKLEKIAWREIS
jgi:hypothetical protein